MRWSEECEQHGLLSIFSCSSSTSFFLTRVELRVLYFFPTNDAMIYLHPNDVENVYITQQRMKKRNEAHIPMENKNM